MALPYHSKQECIEEFLRKSLLGEEIVNTQFHLFSARSSTSDLVVKPRVICANNILLAKSSKYFLDLLSSDIHSSDPSLSDLAGDNDIPSDFRIGDYGYASDSDLDDEQEEDEPPVRIVETNAPKDRFGMAPKPPFQMSGVMPLGKDDDELSDDGSASVSSDIFVMSPEHPTVDPPPLDGSRSSVASSKTLGNKPSASLISAAMRLRSLGNRHILVKDTAFQTWYTLLNYLYNGKFNFLPLTSATFGGQAFISSTSSRDEPECSAKSMYRLACKVGLDHLRGEAMAHIRHNLSENNILKEISCSLVSKHPELLEMELDVLYAHIASPPVVAGFPALAQRIALRELSHGAEIIVGIHTRVLKERRSLPPTPRRAWEPVFPSSRPRSPSIPFAEPVSVSPMCATVLPPTTLGANIVLQPESPRQSSVQLEGPVGNSFFAFQTPLPPVPPVYETAEEPPQEEDYKKMSFGVKGKKPGIGRESRLKGKK